MVQGVAEVVPVSSSAQLTLLPWLLRWPAPPDRTTFSAGLHAGSCLGVAVALRHDLRHLDARTTGLLAAASVPAAVAGLFAHDTVERKLGRPGPTAALLAAAGVLLWAADRGRSTESVGPKQAAAAALAQVVALAPGVSRSGATLTALRAMGVQRDEAMRFTMLMSLPVTAGAAGLTLVRARQLPAGVTAGAPVAAVAALTTATLLESRTSQVPALAAVYRLGVATAVAVRLARRGKR